MDEVTEQRLQKALSQAMTLAERLKRLAHLRQWESHVLREALVAIQRSPDDVAAIRAIADEVLAKSFVVDPDLEDL